ncbi:hypothetical protein QUA62_08810 [Microcoleus sp. MON1_C1]|uniref:hypothetical protein n=1 Tax=Microcoleus sp. MON1_C1 TaxID=2818827 RepID=UPI002FD715D6
MTITRVSVDSAGNQAIDRSDIPSLGDPSISADGRFVTFSSKASNLVPEDTNGCISVLHIYQVES